MPSVPTFTPAVYADHKRKDGSYNVKIRVTFKRQSRRLPTTIFVTAPDLTRSLKIKNSAKLDALEDLTRRMRKTLDGLTIFELEEMTVDDVVEHVRRHMNGGADFRLDFIEYARRYAETSAVSRSAKGAYKAAISALDEYTGRRGLDISEMTSSFLHRFEESERRRLDAKCGRRPHGALHQYFCIYQKIHRAARMEYNDEEIGEVRIRNPFEFYTTPPPPAPRHRDISEKTLRLMYKERKDLEGFERIAVDAFLLSFALIGINEIDLLELSMLPGSRDVVRYFRHKTRERRADDAEMQIRLEPFAREIGSDYRTKGQPQIYSFSNIYKTLFTFTHAVNNGLRKWQRRHRLEAFTYYSARHTWATVAAKIGVQDGTITAALDHVDTARRVDNIYIRREWSTVWDANAAVLEHVFGKA